MKFGTVCANIIKGNEARLKNGPGAGRPGKRPEKRFGGMSKILIVDDYKWGRLVLAEELAENGYEVLETGDPFAVMKLIIENNPDLVVLEPGLVDLDGLELLQEIRFKHYNLPIVLWTASYESKHDPRVSAADYCVLKGTELVDLKCKIERALEVSGCFAQDSLPEENYQSFSA